MAQSSFRAFLSQRKFILFPLILVSMVAAAAVIPTNLLVDGNLSVSSLTASRAVVSDGSKVLTSSDVTTTELGYVSGVTSSIQNQLDLKALDSDLTTHTGASTAHGTGSAIVGISDGQTLTNKTIDDDDNTIQDLAVSAFKTVIGNANTVLTFNGSGAPAAIKVTPTYISSGAASNYEFLQADGFGNTNFEPIIAAAIDSESSTDGYVLTSDGAGGAAWEEAPAAALEPLVTTYLSGSGTHTFTGTPKWVEIEAVGGGGGGGGSGTTAGTAATAGGATTFGTGLISAGGGGIGARDAEGGAGGNSSLGTGPTGSAVAGGNGQGVMRMGTSPVSSMFGGQGGSSCRGGNGGGGSAGGTGSGTAGRTNTGGGGGGAYSGPVANSITGSGGGAGGCVKAIISGATLSGLGGSAAYAVGAGGTGQAAGTSGFAGGPGGSGELIVIEYY